MKKRISITIESTQGPMTGQQIVAAIGDINESMRDLMPFGVQPDIQVHGQGGDVYKVQGLFTREIEL